MSNYNQLFTQHFNDFLLELRRNQFSIGHDAFIQSVRVIDWFLNKEETQKPLNSIFNRLQGKEEEDPFKKLGVYLSGVLCKSNEEQEQFDTLFKNFIDRYTSIAAAQKKEEEKAKRIKLLKKLAWAAVILLPVIAIAAILLWPHKCHTFKAPIHFANIKDTVAGSNPEIVTYSCYPAFSNMADTAHFTIDYYFTEDGTHEKGPVATHRFDSLMFDTVKVHYVTRDRCIDTTVNLYSPSFRDPKIELTYTPFDEVYSGEVVQLAATFDTTYHLSYYWQIQNDETSQIDTAIYNTLTFNYKFTTAGSYTVLFHLANKNESPHYPAWGRQIPIVVKSPELSLEFTGVPLADNAAYAFNKWWAIIPAIILLACILVLIILQLQIRRQHKIQTGAKGGRNFAGNMGPASITFPSKEHYIANQPVVKLAQMFKQRSEVEMQLLDVNQTVEGSIKNQGFLTPAYRDKINPQQYIFLIDRKYENSQQLKLFEYLVRVMLKSSVDLDFYYFQNTPVEFFAHNASHSLSITTLKDNSYKAAIVVISNGSPFISPSGGVTTALADDFSYWQNRILVTPAPYNDWGSTERELGTLFTLVPADMKGWMDVIKVLNEGKNDALKKWPEYENYLTYNARFADFTTVQGLKEYLDNEELFQWVCAMALYPGLDWNIVLELGHTLLTGTNEVNYKNLLKLARIAWLNEGTIPGNVRLKLLKNLTIDNELKARAKIYTLLHELRVTEADYLYERIQLQKYINAFVLYNSGHETYETIPGVEDDAHRFLAVYKTGGFPDVSAKQYLEKQDGHYETPVTINGKPVGLDAFLAETDTPEAQRLKKARTAMMVTGVATLMLLACVAIANFFGGNNFNQALHITHQHNTPSTVMELQVEGTSCARALVKSNGGKPVQIILEGNSDTTFTLPVDSVITLPLAFFDNDTTVVNGRVRFTDKLMFDFEINRIAYHNTMQLVGKCEGIKPDTAQIIVELHARNNDNAERFANAFKYSGYNYSVWDTLPDGFTHANYFLYPDNINPQIVLGALTKAINAGLRLRKILKYYAAANLIDTSKIIISGSAEYENLPVITADKAKCAIYPCNDSITVYIQYGDRTKLALAQKIRERLRKNGYKVPEDEMRTYTAAPVIRYTYPQSKAAATSIAQLLYAENLASLKVEYFRDGDITIAEKTVEIWVPSDIEPLGKVRVVIDINMIGDKKYTNQYSISNVEILQDKTITSLGPRNSSNSFEGRISPGRFTLNFIGSYNNKRVSITNSDLGAFSDTLMKLNFAPLIPIAGKVVDANTSKSIPSLGLNFITIDGTSAYRIGSAISDEQGAFDTVFLITHWQPAKAEVQIIYKGAGYESYTGPYESSGYQVVKLKPVDDPSPLSLKGHILDLSAENEWNVAAVKNAGIIGVIHRATMGSKLEDEKYSSRKNEATAAGLNWGAYHLLTFNENVSAQVKNFITIAGTKRSEYKAIIFETNSIMSKGVNEKITCIEILDNFIKEYEQLTGTYPVIYCRASLYDLLTENSGKYPTLKKCDYWISNYIQPFSMDKYPGPKRTNIILWQYTNQGQIPGIKGNETLNVVLPGVVFRWPFASERKSAK